MNSPWLRSHPSRPPTRSRPGRRGIRKIAFATFVAFGSLIVTYLFALPASAVTDRWDPPTPQADHLVEGTPIPVKDRPDDAAEKQAMREAPKVTWPEPGEATADLPETGKTGVTGTGEENPVLVKLSGLPVRVGPATAEASGATLTSDTPQRVRVAVLDRPDEKAADIADVRLRVTRADGATKAAPVALEVDYSAFRHAYGGDWAARLRLVELPACALTEVPGIGTCPAPQPVPTRNDAARGTLTADVTAAASTAVVATGEGLYALAATPSGSTGDFTATPISPSAEWKVSAQSGDFSWSYGLRTPPSLGGPMPELTLGYSAGGADGRTASTNNQPSWVGEGFDLNPGGAIERKYKSCPEDGVTPKNGEQCWAGENAVLTLGGKSSELVRDSDTGTWRLKNDDGSRVEKLTGAVNDDNDGEHWKVTQTDGTQYFFGLNRLPGWSSGKQETKSAWAAPVYGNNDGEPCKKDTYAASWCQQAYRWNLDHVIDVHGNTMSFFYLQEKNRYGRNLKPADVTPYTAGGHLERIEYGQRAGEVYSAKAVGKVLFEVAERCVRTDAFDCAPAKLTKANAKHWPDVPFDLLCTEGDKCTNHAAGFFSRKRLASVTTQVLKDGAHSDVDSWTFTQSFPTPGDNMSAALWLEKIQHTGKVGGTLSTPAVDFDGVEMPNRVDGLEGLAPMMKWRIRSVNNESGGRLTVNYSGPDCTRAALPEPHTNGKRCFPINWMPEGAAKPLQDWFHKYLAVQVLETDMTGGSPTVRTDYQHLGTPAWAYDNQRFLPAARRTWSQWRGYERVRVVKGESSDQRTAVESLFFRGMDGDKQPSGTRDVQVTDSENVKVDDHWRLQGFERETRQLNGPDGAEVSGTINDPWLKGPNASEPGGQAYQLAVAKTRNRVKLSTGAVRRTETRHTYDSYGSLTETDDLGDTSTPDDDRCVRNTYVRNTDALIVNTVSRSETVTVACGTTPQRPADVLADAKFFFDGKAHGVAPVKGDVTRVEELASHSAGQPQYVVVTRDVFDVYGRSIEQYDVTGAKTTTAYVPATGAPPTQITTTNALGHTETHTMKPEWAVMAAQNDANDRRTELAYDPLGRLVKVWLPGRQTSQTPNQEFSYQMRQNAPTAIATKTLRDDGTYSTAYELYDGLMRRRQDQHAAHGGGRLLSDTVYNTLGQIAKTNDVYVNADPPSDVLLGVPDNNVPAQTVFSYDGLGRTTAEILKVMGTEKWRTKIAHFGDRVDTEPPAGATPTSALLDGRGRTVGLRQYKGSTATGDSDLTRYGFGRNGVQNSVTDAVGNVWRTTHDLRGRVIKTEDPDKGTTTFTYDQQDRLTSTTDARGRTLAFVYDGLGRRTATHEGSATGPKIASWTYDTLADGTSVKGLPVSSTRFSGENAYTTRVNSYDNSYRVTSSSYVIPAAEGALAQTYTFSSRYNADGTLQSTTYPAVGNLPAETVRTTYTDQAAPLQTRSSLGMYVNDTLYSKTGEVLQERWGAEGSQILHDRTYEEGTRRLLRTITDRQTSSQVRQADVNYSYDAAGNITRIANTPPAGNAPSDIQCFGYDYLRRLSQAWTTTGQCAATPTASVVGGASPYWSSYTYDVTGSRKTETRHAAGALTGDAVSTYSYPAAGQPRPHALQRVSTTGPGGDQVADYTYDAAGNTIVRKLGSAEQRLEWDAEGHLAKVTEAGKTTSFLYDSEGNRLIRRDASGTVLYLGTMEVKLPAGTSAPTATRYYNHGGKPVAVRGNDQRLTWLVSDHHGTGQLAIDAGSLAVTRRMSDPFGNPRGTVPTGWPTERGFVGGTTDPSTGFVHLGAREYLPSEGRFLSVDPVFDPSEPQKLQGYAYANNNPVTMTDPNGQDFGCMVCAIAGFVARAYEFGQRARNAWNHWAARARAMYEEARERARRAAEEARRRIEEARRRAQEARRRAQEAREKARREMDKARRTVSRHCRVLFNNCDLGRTLNKSGIGKPLDCGAFPDSGACSKRLADDRKTLHKHLKFQGGVCAGVCVNVSYQRGVVQVSAGGPGVGAGGSAQWTTGPPEESGAVEVSACGVIPPVPVGPCVTAGPRVDSEGNWTGTQGAIGAAFGGKIQASGGYTVASWDMAKGREGITGPQDPLPKQLQGPICDAWWSWYC